MRPNQTWFGMIPHWVSSGAITAVKRVGHDIKTNFTSL
jgi:hypothetical protein